MNIERALREAVDITPTGAGGDWDMTLDEVAGETFVFLSVESYKSPRYGRDGYIATVVNVKDKAKKSVRLLIDSVVLSESIAAWLAANKKFKPFRATIYARESARGRRYFTFRG